MTVRMQQRRGTAAEWTSANTVLSAGEIGFETDTSKFKIGDGTTAWNSLPYFVNADDIETGLLDTDEVSEGTTNLYFTDARAQAAVATDISNAIDATDTDDIEEGTTNLYFTNQRAIDAVIDNIELDDLSDVNVVSEIIVSTAGETWTTQTSNFGFTNINSIAYGDNLWVAGGIDGQLRTSTDAVTWTTRESVTADIGEGTELIPIRSVAYGDNLWIVGGNFGQIRTSTDAINWVTQTSNFGNTHINSIAYGDNLWVAGGDFGQVRTSTDAITWITQATITAQGEEGPEPVKILSLLNADNIWVIGGWIGAILTSTNAINWTERTSNLGFNNVNALSYANNLWLAGTGYPSGQIGTSTDAINWVTQTSNFGDADINSIAYGDNLWVAGGDSGQLRNSTDAITWVTQTSNFGNSRINSIAYGDNLWVAGGDSGQLRTSQTLTGIEYPNNNDALVFDTSTNSWIPGSVAIDSLNDINDVNITTPANGEVLVYSDGDWVNQEASGGGGGISDILEESSDIDFFLKAGTLWAPQQSNFGFYEANSVDYGNGVFVAVGNLGRIRSSTDGITWVTQGLASNTNFRKVSYGENVWIAAGTGGSLRTSTDTVAWVTRNSNFGSSTIQSVAYSDGLWVAGGYSGKIATSSDNGVTWITRNSNFGNTTVNSIAYGDGIWLAVGGAGLVRTSTNAINWVTKNLNINISSGYRVAYGEGLWALGGSSIIISTDTNTWTTGLGYIPPFGSIRELTYKNGLWFAGSAYNTVLSSTDGTTWVTNNIKDGDSTSVSSDVSSITYGNDMFVLVKNKSFGFNADLIQDGVIYTSKDIVGRSAKNITLSSEDANSLIQIDSPMKSIVTIPSNTSDPISTKTQINIVRSGDGDVVFEAEKEKELRIGGALTFVSENAASANFVSEANNGYKDIAYGKDYFVAVGGGRGDAYNANFRGKIDISSDGINWEKSLSARTTAPMEMVAYGNGIFAVYSHYALTVDPEDGGEGEGEETYSSKVLISSDLKNWHVSANLKDVLNLSGSQPTRIDSRPLPKMVFGDGKWLLHNISLGSPSVARNAFLTSTDTINWVSQNSNFASTAGVSAVAYANGLWVAGSSVGEIRSSTDAVTWVTQNSNMTSFMYSLSYGNGVWVAVGGQNAIRSSTDAVTWVTHPSVSGIGIEIISNIDGLWLGRIPGFNSSRVSTDLITWSTRPAPISVERVAYGDNRLVYAQGDSDWYNPPQTPLTFYSDNYFVENTQVNINSTPGNKLRDQWSVASAIKTGENSWIITGDLDEE